MDEIENNDVNASQNFAYIPMTSIASNVFQKFTRDISFLTVQIVNVIFIEKANGTFVLVDAGMPRSENAILDTVGENFGPAAKPEAIILTHAHFDHIGALEALCTRWDVPVYAHREELPYLTGQKNYPPPDGSVEGGLVAKMAPLFPNEGIDLQEKVQPLPEDGTVPHLPEWQWIHTPGHTDGHISLFRKKTRTLIAGDAFVTVRQDKLLNVLTQKQEITGPPRYFTTDWHRAKESVKKLASLAPNEAITGHGMPMYGDALTKGLYQLAESFDEQAKPDYGKYV